MATPPVEGEDPAFISYLLDPEEEYNCYFQVGNAELTTPVKIGVVKKMLLAHSPVLRAELHGSKIAEKGVVSVSDLYPDTFKNFLRYVYGHDTTATMCFNDADNLLYAAEKYMVDKLKNKLATRLMELLTYDNICSLMNNPACYRHLELNSAINKFLQDHTRSVLSSPQFLDLSSEAFLRVLEQESLGVHEIDIWRSALKWAKRRADSEDGETLRQELKPHLKRIRLCTVSGNDLCKEVVPSNILTSSEVLMVCKAVALSEAQTELTEICNTVDLRTQFKRSGLLQAVFPHSSIFHPNNPTFEMSFNTKSVSVELFSFVIKANSQHNSGTYQCDCTIKIVCLSDESVPPISIGYHGQVKYSEEFQIPAVDNGGQCVCLLPNSQYTVTVTYRSCCTLLFDMNTSRYESEHFTIVYYKDSSHNYWNPFKRMFYNTLTPRGTP